MNLLAATLNENLGEIVSKLNDLMDMLLALHYPLRLRR